MCAGVRSRDLAAQMGDRVNIYPVKGYSITVNMNEDDKVSQNAAPWVSLLDDDPSPTPTPTLTPTLTVTPTLTLTLTR